MRCGEASFEIAHTAVSGFEEDSEFVKMLQPINVEYMLDQEGEDGCLLKSKMAHALRDDSEEYEAYKDIQNNYVSAFCYDCVCLIELACRKGHATLRALLDDSTLDDARRTATVIQDLDFGVTGDAHAGVFMKRILPRKMQRG